MTDPTEIANDHEVIDRYKIIKPLSEGWAGRVFLVEDTHENNVKRALKVQPLLKTPATIANNPRMESKAGEYLNTLLRTGKTTAYVETLRSFRFWNFVRPNSWFQRTFRWHDHWFIVCELVDGTNLKKVLREETDTKVTVDFLRSVIFQVLFALLVAQRELHFTHYDVWAKNVMLTHQVTPAVDATNDGDKKAGSSEEGKKEASLWSFKWRDRNFYIPAAHTDGQVCKIFDYGLARVEVKKKDGKVDVAQDRNIMHHQFNEQYDMKNFAFSMLEKIDPDVFERLAEETPGLNDVFSKMLGLETAHPTVRRVSRFESFDLFRPHRRVVEVSRSIHGSRWFDIWARWTWVLNVHDTKMKIDDILTMPFFADVYSVDEVGGEEAAKGAVCLGKFDD